MMARNEKEKKKGRKKKERKPRSSYLPSLQYFELEPAHSHDRATANAPEDLLQADDEVV